MSKCYELSDASWDLIKDLVSPEQRMGRHRTRLYALLTADQTLAPTPNTQQNPSRNPILQVLSSILLYQCG